MVNKKILLVCLIFVAQLLAFNSYAIGPYLEGIEFGYILSRYSHHLSDTTLSGIDGRLVAAYFNSNFQLLLGVSYQCNIRETLPPYSYPLELGYREFALSLATRYHPQSLVRVTPYFGISALFEYIMSRIEDEEPKEFSTYRTETQNTVGFNFFVGIHFPISRRLGLFGEGRFAITQNIGCCNAGANFERASVVTGLSFRL